MWLLRHPPSDHGVANVDDGVDNGAFVHFVFANLDRAFKSDSGGVGTHSGLPFSPNGRKAASILHHIKQCSKFQLPLQGKKAHAHVIKSGLDLHGPLFPNALINMYGKCGHLEDALHVFDTMPHRDLVSWASIFTAHNQANLPTRTLLLFSRMIFGGGPDPDHFIFASLVRACAGSSALGPGLQLHARFLVSPYSDDDVVKSALVDFYAKCGLPDEANKVFSSIVSKNVVSWTSLMYGYARMGRKSETLELLHKMPCKNLHSWTALISGFVQGGHSIESFKIFNEMRGEGVDNQEPFIFSSLIAGSASLAMLALGKQVHRLVIGLGFESNSYLNNALIDMYAKCSEILSAEKIFKSMKTRDIISWTSIIVGLAQHGRADEALSFYDEMIITDLKPNEVTFTGLIYACSHAGLVERGLQLFNSMVDDFGIKPSLQHYTCLVDLYSRSGHLEKAEHVLNSMPFEPDEAVWATLLSACAQKGETETGVRIANHLLQVGLEDPSTCILMSNVYARAAMWERVSAVRKLMANLEVKKEPGYSCVDLGKENEVFYAGESAHAMKDEIFECLKELDEEMRRRGYLPDTSFVLHDMEQQEKERQLFWHSERLAVAYGLLKSSPGSCIRVIKNLRVCGDCHTVLKFISSIVGREIVVRDANRFHRFKDGLCSCRDFWRNNFLCCLAGQWTIEGRALSLGNLARVGGIAEGGGDWGEPARYPAIRNQFPNFILKDNDLLEGYGIDVDESRS
ncbi:Pentatricopeptide repeat-containing protein -mitochondrial [Striga hermonthica]|uniref:Pentatricopeptide repeat-containing protein -mitochondrial n=1 Tax=Striga hermonthica TaxID=68872 RepID=A0A9N7N1Y9_STRHE|nr:Pentatricopeptide repeat-containing protein -mitochondrial [Striga hermonthica]